MYKLVVFSALLAVAAAHGIAYNAPLPYAASHLVNSHVVAAPVATPVVQTYSAPAVAVGHVINKHVHYASQPVVTGYTSQILKPNLGSIATPLATVTQQRVLAPARTVATITPQVTQVEPELHVRKVPVDVPVHQPYISEVEVRHPAPIIAHAAPAVHVHSAPAVAVHSAPAVAVHSAPAVAVHSAPALAYTHNVAAHNLYSAPVYAGVKSASVW